MARDFHGGKARRKALLGLHLERPTADISQLTGEAIFNIVGGKVLLTSIVGEVTEEIGGANAVKLIGNPTLSTATDTDLCTAVDINTCDVGDIISITGVPGDALYGAHLTAVPVMQCQGVVLQTGTLDQHSASAGVSGQIKWVITYVPLDDDAYMTVA